MLSLRVVAFGLFTLSSFAQVIPQVAAVKAESELQAKQAASPASSEAPKQVGKASTTLAKPAPGKEGTASAMPTPARGPCLIYAASRVQGGTQLLTTSLVDRSSQAIGPVLPRADIEGLAFHPRFGTLYALSGPESESPGMVYLVAKDTGKLRTLGATGFRHARGLAFRYRDATLWTWDEEKGLVQIDINTGHGTMAFAKEDLRLETLAWDAQGTILFGAHGRDLWVYDALKGKLAKEDDALPPKSELFLMRPDGNLLLAEAHGKPPENLLLSVYNTSGKQVVNSFRLDGPFDHLEAIAWQGACGNPDPGGRVQLIRSIPVDNSKICQGDEAKIVVETVHPDGPPNKVDVFINQLAGATQYVEFTGPAGIRRIAVAAWTPERYVDYGETSINVGSCIHNPPRPLVRIGPNPFHPNNADFIIANAGAFAEPIPIAFRTSAQRLYSWDFGDGKKTTTAVPFVTHDYSDSIPRDDRYGNLVASISVELGNPAGSPPTTVLSTAHKSVTLFNFYGFNRSMGIIQPPTQVGDAQLVDQLPDDSGRGYLGTFSLTNVDYSPLTLTGSQLERQYCDPDKESLRLPSTSGQDVLTPGQKIQRLVVLGTVGDLGEDVCGVVFHLFGSEPLGRQVLANLYYKIRDNPLMHAQVTNPRTIQALNQAAAIKALPPNGVISDEDLYQLSKEGLLVLATEPTAGKIAYIMSGITNSPPASCGKPKSCDDVSEPQMGSPCDPTCAPIRPGLVCAIGPGSGSGGAFLSTDWCTDPAHIQNAEKGDSVMSPGCGTIGALLHALPNPQHFSHVGIMTRDRYELADSTASQDLLSEGDANDGLGGSAGWKPDLFRFAWPGSIEQTIDEAFVFPGSSIYNALFNKTYHEQPLSSDPERCAGDADLIFPRVARGTPEERDALHSVADVAKAATVGSGSQLGDVGKFHYRFFSYTKGDVATSTQFQPDSGTPPDDPGLLNALYDASGLTLSHVAVRPSVCSSFIWQMLQDAGVPNTIREPDAFNQGVLASSASPGLVFYPVADRLAAGFSLFNNVYNQVQTHCPPDPLPCLGAPTNHAVQAINCFAFDNCEEWSGLNPFEWINQVGDGNAVSPDNMLLWTVYPVNEPIVFRQGLFRRPYTWQAASGTGCISGQVLAPQQFIPKGVPGATVYIRGLQRKNGEDVSTVTDPNGNFSFQAIPALTSGSYCLHAQVFTQNNACFDEGETCQVQVKPQPNACAIATILLQPPPQIMRTVTMTGTIQTENNGDSPTDAVSLVCHLNVDDSTTNLAANLDCSPEKHQPVNYEEGWISMTAHLNADLSISAHVHGEMDHCGGGIWAHGCPDATYGPFDTDLVVPPGQTVSLPPNIHIPNDDNSDWVNFNGIQISNNCAGCFGKQTCSSP